MRLSRRGFGFGAGILALIGAGGLGYRFSGHWYPPTPYDDLLHQIVDRKPSAALGKLVRIEGSAPEKLAARLRQPGFKLAERSRADAAAGRMTEADGWLVPETVALYAALAAQA
ncbi:MAG TPA: hypothetical protein VG501_07210 [Rhizomicrobium sp.]|nr:hypothetical protein [Rhizomicrobium sp.]